MMPSDEPMTSADFDAALEAAMNREILSDTNAPDAVESALERVAQDPTPANIQSARIAFAAFV